MPSWDNPLGLDLHIDVGGELGSRSIAAALREAVTSGRLPAGTRLPGTRSLADDLGIARGTVVEAYAQLVAEGWLVSTTGSGTHVAETRLPAAKATPEPSGRRLLDLRPGRPDLSLFPHRLWAASVKRTLTAAEGSTLDYGDPAGLRVLREAVATYVSRTRGVRAEAEAVVITSGFTHGLALLARALRETGVRTIATEDPGMPHHRRMIEGAGLATAPLPVDPHGADPGAIPAGARAVLLTPSHQHPRGVVLSPSRRAAFLAWADSCDGLLVEDDYDGEFRYDKQPVGALQASAPERVVFAGSTSKALAPGLRIGWLVLPQRLRIPVLDALLLTGATVAAPGQLALADLFERGDYDRHVRRARHTYQKRRADLAARLATLTDVPLDGVPAGLHALLPLATPVEEKRLTDTGLSAGLRVQGLHAAGYWHSARRSKAGLIIGFASPPQHSWHPALDALTRLLDGAAIAPW
ncbi:PLP-dependent aminotransferase family protein [Amycolatopsis sp. FDAARGOS 1241]|uniref:MocR-like pyridoxine biosynthesis transcription factor PdxR n=1 Tax=Amycolatopsis sp. FDAARGOS 1241 TaxID=2778070 RepID=UPI00194E76C3|nr:PLP-dependent aminotransferase family protein [Amycolatopsis sp. FDAARGOS 1241]QRP48506.1 PLP-dependent aminotransferase family protein [Amycolatopsis sp. FDAARGOS 1241]